MINRVGLFFSFAAGLAVYHFVLSDNNWAGSSSAIATATTASLAANPIRAEPVPSTGAGMVQKQQRKSHTFSRTSGHDYSAKTVTRWAPIATDQHAAGDLSIDIADPTNNRRNVTEVAKGNSSQLGEIFATSNLRKGDSDGATLTATGRSSKETRARADGVPLPAPAAPARTWLAVAHAAARGEQGAHTFYPSVTPIYSSGSGSTQSYGWRVQRGSRAGSTKRLSARTLSKRATTNELAQKKKVAHRRLEWRQPYGLLGNSNVRRQRKNNVGRVNRQPRNNVRRVNRQRKRAWINKVFNSSIQR